MLDTGNSLASSEKQPRALRRVTIVLGAGWLLTWLALQVPDLPIRLFLKQSLRMGAQDIAVFTMVTGIAWYFKPLVGILSDSTPLLGTRRRHYLLFSLAFGGMAWLLTGALPVTYSMLLWMMTIVNAAIMVASTALGGVLVESGQEYGATGRLTSQRQAIYQGFSLISVPAGG